MADTNGDGIEDEEDPEIPPPVDGGLNDAIVLPDSRNGNDRYLIVEKISSETVSPLVKKELTIEGIYEVINRNFSYPLTAHIGLKMDARNFQNIPKREFDLKMKKVKVPSNYFPLGGNGLDRRYVYSNPDYPANPNTLDLIFMVDDCMSFANKALILRNLKYILGKITSGYTNIRASIWRTYVATAGTEPIINSRTGAKITHFNYYLTDEFVEVETPDSSGANNTNLYKKLYDLLSSASLNPASYEVYETEIIDFFLKKSVFSLTDEVGTVSEETVLSKVWSNTVRKVIYLSGSTPETMQQNTYPALLNHARENCIQVYYFYSVEDTENIDHRSLREFAVDSGGGTFNMWHDSDIALKKFCDDNFNDANKIYYGDWDGTFKIAWTDNPAWVLYDIITDLNYGLGNHVNEKLVDKWTLYDIGRYCDAVDSNGRFLGTPDGKGGLEPRYTCNIIFNNKEEAYKVVKDIAAIFKGIVFWSSEGFSFFADRPKDPIMFFGNANVQNGDFNYTETPRNVRYTSVEVVYNDRYDNYKTKVEFVEDVDGIRKYGINPFKINAAGCTSRSEAKRIGRYVLYSSIFEADTVTFVGGLEAAYLQPGDVFGVSDQVRNIGRTFGRVLEIDKTAKTVRIDGEFQAGLDSGIYIHVPSGNYSVSDLNNLVDQDGGFTGTLRNIAARRQSQVRKFNIKSYDNNYDNGYGSLLTLTGDFLFTSGIVNNMPVETRYYDEATSSVVGNTDLTGNFYIFPDNTVSKGNPNDDTLTFLEVSGVLSSVDIDIDFSGAGATGQVIDYVSNWSGEVSYSVLDGYGTSQVKVNGNVVRTITASDKAAALEINSAGEVAISDMYSNLNDVWTFINGRSDGSIIVILTHGSVISNTSFTPSSNFANYGATEIYTVGKNVSASSSAFGYAAAFIKGGYRMLERASKITNDYGSIRFSYRDLLALSKLRPYWTIVQADVGNRQQAAFPNWVAGRDYTVGAKIQYNSVPYTCVIAHKSKSTFTDDYLVGNIRSKWAIGNNLGYATVSFPNNFYGTTKIPVTTALTSSDVKNAFNSLGIDVYVGAGAYGQTDISNLDQALGIGYSGLVLGTGYPVGVYALNVDTNVRDLDKVQEGSLYVLSGSGVEPKLYKTLSVKEEEANLYSVVGIEYALGKEEFIERDINDSSPTTYVQSPYDVVLKPDAPSSLSASIVGTNINLTWPPVTTTPITGYKIYVSRPDYSSSHSSALTEFYFVNSGTEAVSVPINEIYGQYDIHVYGQGVAPYKFLSNDAASKSVLALPTPTLQVDGHTLTSCIISGFEVDTADPESNTYSVSYNAGLGTFVGNGGGNFTSKHLAFRWKYVDPTGGIVSSLQDLRQNPFLPQHPIKIQLIDQGGSVLEEVADYQGMSYGINEDKNKRLTNNQATDPSTWKPARDLGLRIILTDHLNNPFTGTFNASNVIPHYSVIDVTDSYQNSPYYIISGIYGNSVSTDLAVWCSGADLVVTGSGIRDIDGGLVRSEEEDLFYEDVVRAFTHATKMSDRTKGITINYRGPGGADYEAYVYKYTDLTRYYFERVDKKISIEQFGQSHYQAYGLAEGREVPMTKNNPLGIANFADVPSNKIGFSGLNITVYTDPLSFGEIVFDCYSSASNKDVFIADVYTGDVVGFTPDLINRSNFMKSAEVLNNRSHYNTITLKSSDGIEPKQWYYFRFLPYDDFGTGFMSDAVSGYLQEREEITLRDPYIYIDIDGGVDAPEVIGAPATVMRKDLRYLITDIGSVSNWTSIGASNGQVGEKFIYNGTAVAGSGGQVKRVPIDYVLTEDEIKNTIVFNPRSSTNVILPSSVPDKTVCKFIHDPKTVDGQNSVIIFKIYSQGINEGEELASIVRGESATFIYSSFREKWINTNSNFLVL